MTQRNPHFSVPPTYRPRQPITWWLSNGKYFLFMMRELSALFIAAYIFINLLGIYRLCQGRTHYEAYLEALQTPLAKGLFVVISLFCLYHTVTWFHLTPIVMALRIRGKVISQRAMKFVIYLSWGLISSLLFYLLIAT